MRTAMQHGTSPTFVPSRLALCLAVALLGACGGGSGGGYGGGVRPTPPPPPQPTLPRTLTLPTAPPVGTTPFTPSYNASGSMIKLVNSYESFGETRTDGSLTKSGPGMLVMWGNSRFDGGVNVQDGELLAAQLFADVTVDPGAKLTLWGDIIGDVHVDGEFEPTYDNIYIEYEDFFDADIFGNYSQSATGTMKAILGIEEGAPATPLLSVSGTASLAGTLDIYKAFGYVSSQTNGYLEWILHAYGGISGQFATVKLPPSLFITGNINYTPNDVYFLATRISTSSAIVNAGIGDAMTLSSAHHVDSAFALADDFSLLPHVQLDESQRRFLRSAAAIQRIGDDTQAAATFDSLSGQAHVAAQNLLLDHAAAAPQLQEHLDRVRPGVAGNWSQHYRGGSATAMANTSGNAETSGYDQWLGERLLIGSSVSHGQLQAQFEREDGRARSPVQMASAYLHYRGDDGYYATSLVGAGRTRLSMDRTLDLADAGRHVAHSEREIDAALLHVEAGRRMLLGEGRVTPYVAVNHTSLYTDGFTEAGDTGFELEAQPSQLRRTAGEIGVRYARQWRLGGDRWMQLDLSSRYQRILATDGDPLRAAFVGAPQAVFDIDDLSQTTDYGLLSLNLRGGGGRSTWFFDYDHYVGGKNGDAWWVGWNLAF